MRARTAAMLGAIAATSDRALRTEEERVVDAIASVTGYAVLAPKVDRVEDGRNVYRAIAPGAAVSSFEVRVRADGALVVPWGGDGGTVACLCGSLCAPDTPGRCAECAEEDEGIVRVMHRCWDVAAQEKDPQAAFATRFVRECSARLWSFGRVQQAVERMKALGRALPNAGAPS